MLATTTQRESYRRLFLAKRITEAQLQDRIASGKIDQEDYDYITA